MELVEGCLVEGGGDELEPCGEVEVCAEGFACLGFPLGECDDTEVEHVSFGGVFIGEGQWSLGLDGLDVVGVAFDGALVGESGVRGEDGVVGHGVVPGEGVEVAVEVVALEVGDGGFEVIGDEQDAILGVVECDAVVGVSGGVDEFDVFLGQGELGGEGDVGQAAFDLAVGVVSVKCEEEVPVEVLGEDGVALLVCDDGCVRPCAVAPDMVEVEVCVDDGDGLVVHVLGDVGLDGEHGGDATVGVADDDTVGTFDEIEGGLVGEGGIFRGVGDV